MGKKVKSKAIKKKELPEKEPPARYSGWREFAVSLEPYYEVFLPRGMRAAQISLGFLAALRRAQKPDGTNDIAQCSPASIRLALLLCARLGLEPASPLQHVALVPYKNELKAIVEFRGYVELMYRTGAVRWTHADAVFQGELESGGWAAVLSPPAIRHVWSPDVDRNPDKLVAAYAITELTEAAGGGTFVTVLDRAQVHARRNRSPAWKSGKEDTPWRKDIAAMWRKSAYRAHIQSGELPVSADDRRIVLAGASAGQQLETIRAQLAEAGHRPELPDSVIEVEGDPPPEAITDAKPERPPHDRGAAEKLQTAIVEIDDQAVPTKEELIKMGAKHGETWEGILRDQLGKDWKTRPWSLDERHVIFGLVS